MLADYDLDILPETLGLEDEPPPEYFPATVDDLRPATVTFLVPIDDESGETMREIKVKLLSRVKLLEIRNAVPLPAPPISGYDGQKRPIYNLNDPGWIDQNNLAHYRRNLAALAAMLQMDIGGTQEERRTFLENEADPVITDVLVAAVAEYMVKARAQVKRRADTFHNG
jgi:hypothetical protein